MPGMLHGACNHAERKFAAEFSVAALLATLDRPHMRLRNTDDAVVDAVATGLMHLKLLANQLATDQQVAIKPATQTR